MFSSLSFLPVLSFCIKIGSYIIKWRFVLQLKFRSEIIVVVMVLVCVSVSVCVHVHAHLFLDLLRTSFLTTSCTALLTPPHPVFQLLHPLLISP